MISRRISIVLFVVVFLLTGCGPEAKKKKAMEGGDKYFERGQYKQARLMYMNAVKADPRFGEGYYKLALTNLRLGSPSEALGNLQRTVELQPDNVDAYAKLADLYLAAYVSNPVRGKNLLRDIRDLSGKLEKTGKGSYEDLRLRGYLATAESKFADALALFREADKLRPNQSALQIVIARTMLAMGQTNESIAYLRGMIERDKSNSAAYELLYAIYATQKNEVEAEKLLRERASRGANVDDQLRLAAHYVATQRPEQTESVLAGILKRRSDFPKGYLDVGDFYYRVRNFERSAATYEEGIRQDKERAREYQKRLVEVRVAQSRSQEALDLVEQILKEDPKDAEAIAMRASLWLYAGKPEQINTAISEMQSVVSKMPANFVLRYNLGRALLAKGDLDGARVQFSDALQTRPDYVPARVALAQVQLARREFAAVQQSTSDVLRREPANGQARLILATSYIGLDKFAEARQILLDTLKLFPKFADARYQLGYVLYREKNFKEAEKVFQELYSGESKDQRGLLGLTEVYLATNQPDRALTMLDAEIKKFPNSISLKIARANVAINAKRFDEGIEIYKKVLESDPKNASVVMNLGEGYERKGDLTQALETWKKASELLPRNSLPILRRAMVLEKANRRPEAGPLYEQILKLEPDNVFALNNYAYFLADTLTLTWR
jgi:tetratricopeptide (TPR) repeat protein